MKQNNTSGRRRLLGLALAGGLGMTLAAMPVTGFAADIESMSELVQWGLLQFVSAGLLVTLALGVLLIMSWQLTLLLLLPMRRRMPPLTDRWSHLPRNKP